MYYLYWIHDTQFTDPLTEGYIGISNQPKARFKAHTTNTASVGSSKVREHVDINGINSVKHSILSQHTDLESARKVEKAYRPKPNIGWNIAVGGGVTPDCTGRILDEETKAKIRKKNIKTKATRTYTNKYKGTTGRYTDAQRKHIGSFHIGQTISKEHRQAISDKNSRGNHPSARAVTIKDTLDNSVHEFDNLKTAAETLGIKYPTLKSAVRKNQELVYKRWMIM